MTLTVRVNLTKWEHTKCMGETPKAFIERMTRNIEAVKKNGLAELKEMFENASSAQTKEYYEMLRHFGVIVELCTSSNTKLGNMKTLDEIPYDKYVVEGIPVVVGTDGEGYFRDSMKQEASLISAISEGKTDTMTDSNDSDNGPKKPSKMDKYLGHFLSGWTIHSKLSKTAKGLNMDVTVEEYMFS